ncbi:MAG: helix-turn-helix domain-containing protein [Lachnospiraceae bacterium]|jgi:AraC-like DNA-binding protein|nr:helix-turn-helix domain-containing protein [Lachnospiraceae bacterium]
MLIRHNINIRRIGMENTTELQQQFCSRMDDRKICSFDVEIIDKKTKPILHQTSRFIFINKGRGKMKINEVEYAIHDNMLITLLPFDCTEVTEVRETLQYYVVVYNFVLLNDAIKSIFNVDNQKIEIIKKMQENPVIACDPVKTQDIRSLFGKIKQEVGVESTLQFPEKQALSSVFVVNLLVELMVVSQRNQYDKRFDRVVATKKGEKTEIFRYIYTHLSEKITLSRLAKLFYMSESSISKYIMETTGLTFNNLVNEIKIAKTLNYLMYTDYTLEELAMFLGYVDAAHISKVFESRMGSKISEYRKTYQSVLGVCNIEERRIAYTIITYIVENHKEELTAQTVSAKFEISVPELNKILLLQVERNFSEFLHFLRVNSACKLLAETDMTITDIAIEVGFNTVKTFTRNFVMNKHLTPSAYRQMIREEGGYEA